MYGHTPSPVRPPYPCPGLTKPVQVKFCHKVVLFVVVKFLCYFQINKQICEAHNGICVKHFAIIN